MSKGNHSYRVIAEFKAPKVASHYNFMGSFKSVAQYRNWKVGKSFKLGDVVVVNGDPNIYDGTKWLLLSRYEAKDQNPWKQHINGEWVDSVNLEMKSKAMDDMMKWYAEYQRQSSGSPFAFATATR